METIIPKKFELGAIFVLICVMLASDLAASTTYSMQDHDLDIFSSSPPALVFVQDANNRISGADISKPTDGYGRGSTIEEIPNCYVEQDNIGSDDPGSQHYPQSHTGWSINILDHPKESYTINVVGQTTGVTEIWITALFRVKLKLPKIKQIADIFVASGVTRTIEVSFDPTARALNASPTISGGDFLKDTQSACGLGAISPPEACEALEDLASAVEKAKSAGKSEAEEDELRAYLSILNRLHNWGKDGYRKDWVDLKDRSECHSLCKKDRDGTKFFAKDPAYSALKLDAETLLNGLPKDHDHDHDHDKDDGDHDRDRAKDRR